MGLLTSDFWEWLIAVSPKVLHITVCILHTRLLIYCPYELQKKPQQILLLSLSILLASVTQLAIFFIHSCFRFIYVDEKQKIKWEVPFNHICTGIIPWWSCPDARIDSLIQLIFFSVLYLVRVTALLVLTLDLILIFTHLDLDSEIRIYWSS